MLSWRNSRSNSPPKQQGDTPSARRAAGAASPANETNSFSAKDDAPPPPPSAFGADGVMAALAVLEERLLGAMRVNEEKAARMMADQREMSDRSAASGGATDLGEASTMSQLVSDSSRGGCGGGGGGANGSSFSSKQQQTPNQSHTGSNGAGSAGSPGEAGRRRRRVSAAVRRDSISNIVDPKERAWALIEGDGEIRTMLREMRLRIGDAAERKERLERPPTLADRSAAGALRILIKGATGLLAADSNGLSDPYLKLTIGGVTHRTRTIRKTLDPVWSEAFEFEGVLGSLLEAPVALSVWDYDFASRDDALGATKVDLSGWQLYNEVRRDVSADLDTQGAVQLQVSWVPDEDPAAATSGGGLGERPLARPTSMRRKGAAGGRKHGGSFGRQTTGGVAGALARQSTRRGPNGGGGGSSGHGRSEWWASSGGGKVAAWLGRYVCGRAIHPESRFRFCWNLSLAVFIIFCALAVPLEIAFETDMVHAMCTKVLDVHGTAYTLERVPRGECRNFLLWYWSNFVVDVFFMCDIFVNFRTGFVHEGHFVADDWLIARAYLRGWFCIDLLGTFPLNIVMMLANPDNPYSDDLVAAQMGGSVDAGAAARANRMLRLMRMAKLFKLARMAKLAKYMGTFEELLNPGVVAVFKIVFVAFFCCHLFGCMWWLVSDMEMQSAMDEGVHSPWFSSPWYALGAEGENAWHPPLWLKNEASLGMKYFHAFFWGAGMVTALAPRDIEPLTMLEAIVTTFTMFCGLLLNAFVISSLTNAVASMNAKSEFTGKKIDQIKSYLLIKSVPLELRSRILEYYHYLFTSSAALDDMNMFEHMPPALTTKLALSTNRRLAARCWLFRDVSDVALVKLISDLKPLVFVPGQMIVKEGQPLTATFFINRGIVEILVGSTTQGTLTNSDNFGLDDYHKYWVNLDAEISPSHHSASSSSSSIHPVASSSARAITYCDVMSLSVDELNLMLTTDREFQLAIERKREARDAAATRASQAGDSGGGSSFSRHGADGQQLSQRALSKWPLSRRQLMRLGLGGQRRISEESPGSSGGSGWGGRHRAAREGLSVEQNAVLSLADSISAEAGGAGQTSGVSPAESPGGSSSTAGSPGSKLRQAVMRAAVRLDLGERNADRESGLSA